MPLELWKMWWSVQQVKYHHGLWCWSLVWYWHYWVLKTSVHLRWMPNDVHMERKSSVELHFNCHNECAMRILNQVLSQRCWEFCRLSFFVTCFMHPPMCLFDLSFAPMSHGNSCPHGQLPRSEKCLVIFVVDKNHCKAHTSMSVLVCTNLSRDSIWIAYMYVLQWGPSWEVISYWLLMVVMIMIRLGSYAFVC